MAKAVRGTREEDASVPDLTACLDRARELAGADSEDPAARAELQQLFWRICTEHTKLAALDDETLETTLGRLEAERARRARPSSPPSFTDLAKANRFLDAIIENIPNMIFVKDAERLAFERFNRAGEEMLGLSREALIGKNDNDLFPPDQAEFFQAKDRNTLLSKALLDIPEEPIQTKRGVRWLHTKKVPILDENGQPAYLLGISEDITERKLAAAALVRAKEVAEAASRELEAFSYSVAHDLRAPLRSIDGFSQALLEDYDGKLDEQGRDHLRRVRNAAQRMATLIDDLLKLSRLTRVEMRRERIDLSALARSANSEIAYRSPGRSVELQVADSMWADADARLLGVVMENLLENAWKFTRARAPARIEVGTHDGDGTPVFFVRDNGVGFDMSYVAKLFGVFQRLHSVNEYEGVGVGLATVQRVVQRHGGKAWAEGQVGEGATFYFTLA
ncbi:MAG TPA: ATP-binding protein [Polyangiaceae bacterium]|nr:ATP-binding protein [Polyangiaceae bacterium]